MEREQSLRDRIYSELYEGIIRGEYQAGAVLSEKSLIDRYGVSKSPVREALVALCSEGVLRSMPRYGYEVVRLTGSDVRNILSFRMILESGCLAQCIGSVTPAMLDGLEDLQQACGDGGRDMWSHWSCNSTFHLKLISFTGNEFSHGMLKRARDTLTRAYAQFYWDKWNTAALPTDTKYHPQLIEALRRRDLAGASEALRLDISDFGME